MIKTLIIEGASPPDLGIMRCVSRAWEQVATPLLFSEAVVIFKEKSFANLLGQCVSHEYLLNMTNFTPAMKRPIENNARPLLLTTQCQGGNGFQCVLEARRTYAGGRILCLADRRHHSG